jgi:hypothetical protein
MHVLMHVPQRHIQRFDALIKKWPDDAQEIDCRPATYRTQTTTSGKQTNVMTYITKNSPQAAYGGKRLYQPGGPILGKRCDSSRNLSADERARAAVRGVLRRELRLPYRGTSCPAHKRIEYLNQKTAKSAVIVEEKIPRKIENKSNNSSKLEISKAA